MINKFTPMYNQIKIIGGYVWTLLILIVNLGCLHGTYLLISSSTRCLGDGVNGWDRSTSFRPLRVSLY